MILQFSVEDAKPVSINKAYFKRSNTLTKLAREYRRKLLDQISPLEPEFQKFRDQFNPKTDALAVSLTFGIPHDLFYKQDGAISMRSGDVDNYIKLTLDFLFNEKYWGAENRLTDPEALSYNVCIDDRFIRSLNVKKVPSNNYTIDVRIENSSNKTVR